MVILRPPDRLVKLQAGEVIPRRFFERDPVTCARDLIGCRFVWGKCAGVVVETEAYAANGDEACHTFRRPAARRFVEEHPAGSAYVYLNYGMHWLANVLVRGEADGFVLLRALEPVSGLGQMRLRRGMENDRSLCAGPGRLTQALGIDGRHHGMDLCAGRGRGFRLGSGSIEVVMGPRIGISLAQGHPWRFARAGDPHVSRPWPWANAKQAGPDGIGAGL